MNDPLIAALRATARGYRYAAENPEAAADLLTFVISIPFLFFFFRKHLSAPDAAE